MFPMFESTNTHLQHVICKAPLSSNGWNIWIFYSRVQNWANGEEEWKRLTDSQESMNRKNYSNATIIQFWCFPESFTWDFISIWWVLLQYDKANLSNMKEKSFETIQMRLTQPLGFRGDFRSMKFLNFTSATDNKFSLLHKQRFHCTKNQTTKISWGYLVPKIEILLPKNHSKSSRLILQLLQLGSVTQSITINNFILIWNHIQTNHLVHQSNGT